MASAWKAFIAGEQKDLAHIRPAIRASWQRSHRMRVSPYLQALPLVLSAKELAARQEREDLVRVAVPLFETIVTAWEDEPFAISISDRQGAILYMDGHAETIEKAESINAVPGGGMAEEHIGTAAANLVLAQRKPDYVVWSEHYCEAFHSWATIGAPIRHPLSHDVVGTIVVSGDELTHPHAVTLVEKIATHIEQLIHHEELDRRVILLDEHQRFSLAHPHDAVLAIDRRGHVCGVSSLIGRLLDAPHQLLESSIFEVPNLELTGLYSPQQHEDVQPYELQVYLPKKELSFPATAIPISGERQSLGTLVVLSAAHATRALQGRATASSWSATTTFSDLIGSAVPFRASLAQANQAASGDFPVLLLGESGTGKDLFAQAIHTAGPRCVGPFVAFNCGQASDELLVAELFGYVEGAFTGAAKGGKKGKIELAHTGTLFLDEVEAMPDKMQVSLLRVLGENRVTRIGAERPTGVDIRVIAASNEDLKTAVEDKRFRLDLYHRLAVFPIHLPPLRERREDVSLLVQYLLRQLGREDLRLAPEVLPLFHAYAWPGNIRELRNVLLRASQFAVGNMITPAELPPEVQTAAESSATTHQSLRDTEREEIRRTLVTVGGNLSRAAERLGIHRVTLYRKLKRYGLSASGETQEG